MDTFGQIYTRCPLFDSEKSYEEVINEYGEYPMDCWDECIPLEKWEGVTLNESGKVSKLDLSQFFGSGRRGTFSNEESFYYWMMGGGFMKCLSLLSDLEELDIRNDRKSHLGNTIMSSLKILHIGDSSGRYLRMFENFFKKNQHLEELHVYRDSDEDQIFNNQDKVKELIPNCKLIFHES